MKLSAWFWNRCTAVDLAKIPSMMLATANAPDHQDIRQVLAT